MKPTVGDIAARVVNFPEIFWKFPEILAEAWKL